LIAKELLGEADSKMADDRKAGWLRRVSWAAIIKHQWSEYVIPFIAAYTYFIGFELELPPHSRFEHVLVFGFTVSPVISRTNKLAGRQCRR
jgi:hypothetical protein